jgi:hypothetical protein
MSSFTFRTIVLAGFIFIATSLVQAQATRTWVSGVGDDTLPCSITTPCKTFQVALSKTAAGGEINCLTPGGFGPVTITNGITIDCTGTLGGIMVGTGLTGITISASTNIVRLRGLSINGTNGQGTTGISITGAGKVYIEDTVIDGFQLNGISMTGAAALYISNTTVRNNSGNGININPSAKTVGSIFNTRLANNSAGINVQTGQIAVTNCMISGNVLGISASNGGTVIISGNTISENTTNLQAIATGTRSFIVSYGNNATYGNLNSNPPTSTQGLQ